MRQRLFAIAVNTLTIGAMPAAGAALLGHASQPHKASVAITPASVTILPPGSRSLFANFSMAWTNAQWDAPITVPPRNYPQGYHPYDHVDAVDVIDANGRNYDRGYSLACVPRTATVSRCTLTYPPTSSYAGDLAPWIAVVVHVTPAGTAPPVTITLDLYPG